MTTYLDTGALVPLYVNEVFTNAITSYIEERGEAVTLHSFHRLEFENALRLKLFRGDLTHEQFLDVQRKVASHIDLGMLMIRSVNWLSAFETARTLSEVTTAEIGCRTLDLIHVAIAMQWSCVDFVSTDDRQLKAARRSGLNTVDLRQLIDSNRDSR